MGLNVLLLPDIYHICRARHTRSSHRKPRLQFWIPLICCRIKTVWFKQYNPLRDWSPKLPRCTLFTERPQGSQSLTCSCRTIMESGKPLLAYNLLQRSRIFCLRKTCILPVSRYHRPLFVLISFSLCIFAHIQATDKNPTRLFVFSIILTCTTEIVQDALNV